MVTPQKQPQQQRPAAADFRLASQLLSRFSRAPACENCEICPDEVAPSATLRRFPLRPSESHSSAERPSSAA